MKNKHYIHKEKFNNHLNYQTTNSSIWKFVLSIILLIGVVLFCLIYTANASSIDEPLKKSNDHIKVVEKLVDNGHTVLFIEHNSTLLCISNEVITLGPGSGENGGELI